MYVLGTLFVFVAFAAINVVAVKREWADRMWRQLLAFFGCTSQCL